MSNAVIMPDVSALVMCFAGVCWRQWPGGVRRCGAAGATPRTQHKYLPGLPQPHGAPQLTLEVSHNSWNSSCQRWPYVVRWTAERGQATLIRQKIQLSHRTSRISSDSCFGSDELKAGDCLQRLAAHKQLCQRRPAGPCLLQPQRERRIANCPHEARSQAQRAAAAADTEANSASRGSPCGDGQWRARDTASWPTPGACRQGFTHGTGTQSLSNGVLPLYEGPLLHECVDSNFYLKLSLHQQGMGWDRGPSA